MPKKEWKRGEQADVIAAIAEAYLRLKMSEDLKKLCTQIQLVLSEKKLGIDICPSKLKGILMAEKRPFCMVRMPGKGMHVTWGSEFLLDVIRELMPPKTAKPSKVRQIRTASIFGHRANVR